MRYKVEESRIAPGTFNVVDTKKVVAVLMHVAKDRAETEAGNRNAEAAK